MIFLDIETKNTSEEDYFSTKGLQISYVGVIDASGKEYDFWEDDIPKLGELMRAQDWIIGYNSIGFDLPVIANYLGPDVNELPQVDLMVAAYKTIGFRPKLDDLVMATLGKGKLGKGVDATKYWASGDLDSLRKYCLEDVRLTKELYEYGNTYGKIKYYDKTGFLKEVNIDWNLGKKENRPVEQNLSLF